MKERLVLVRGRNVSLVAQDKDFGDAENFVKSRPNGSKLLDIIGAHGNKYDVATVEKYMPEPSLEIGDKKIFTIIHNEDGRYLGDIRFVKTDLVYELGIVITESQKGFGTETIKLASEYAFNSLSAKSICVRIYQNNPISFRFFTKLGFRYTSTTNDGYAVNGVSYLEDWLYLDSLQNFPK